MASRSRMASLLRQWAQQRSDLASLTAAVAQTLQRGAAVQRAIAGRQLGVLSRFPELPQRLQAAQARRCDALLADALGLLAGMARLLVQLRATADSLAANAADASSCMATEAATSLVALLSAELQVKTALMRAIVPSKPESWSNLTRHMSIEPSPDRQGQIQRLEKALLDSR